MQIDLHTHSYFSDAEYSPEEVIAEAKKRKVSILSITEHNFIPETEIIKEYAKKNNIVFIEGIEISTVWRILGSTTSLHVLGYGKKLDSGLLNKSLKKTIDGYNNRACAIIDKLNKAFPELALDFQSLKVNSKEAYVSRNTLARLLVEHFKNTLSIEEVLKQYVFVEEDDSWMMTPEESFKLITTAGGVPILAHSGRELRKMGLIEYEKMVVGFVEAGLLGLEVYYSKHTNKETDTIKHTANKFKLYITGGSDWHGRTYTPEIEIGRELQAEDVAAFLSDKRIGVL
ncbi:PHP domain-containing protein [Candidatus Falkowbacteria bacterium]|nr:PHP domain-containing protein [Candidatus Falkowbacteria bacterium]